MFKVMIECAAFCEGWELTREVFQTDDPVEAIRQSDIYRDESHHSWVEIEKPTSDRTIQDVVADREKLDAEYFAKSEVLTTEFENLNKGD